MQPGEGTYWNHMGFLGCMFPGQLPSAPLPYFSVWLSQTISRFLCLPDLYVTVPSTSWYEGQSVPGHLWTTNGFNLKPMKFFFFQGFFPTLQACLASFPGP